MNEFSWALTAFVLLHIGVSATGLRAGIVKTIGEWPYRGLFSLASLALLVWLVHGYNVMRADPFDELNGALWAPADWLRWPAYFFIVLGLTLAFTGILTPSPTRIGSERSQLAKEEPATGVVRITRHPFLWGVALWGLGHVLVNGERFALMLFGALALMALFGARSIDRKGRARDPEAWDRFAAKTSNAPFAAIVQGRNRLALSAPKMLEENATVLIARRVDDPQTQIAERSEARMLAWRVLAALATVVAIALMHQRLFGVPAFSTSP